MPEEHEPGETHETEEGELMNLSQLAQSLGVSRQWLHRVRLDDPSFPASRSRPGSTREFWDPAEVRTYWDARELRPGARTDLKGKPAAE